MPKIHLLPILLLALASTAQAGVRELDWVTWNPTPIMQSASAGDIDRIKQLIASGTNVNEQSEHGATALMTAAEAGKVETIRFLLGSGAKPNLCSKHGPCPIQFAVRKKSVEAVRVLLAAGADPDQKTFGQLESPPLAAAAEDGSQEIARLLVEHGADVNRLIFYSQSAPLQAAVWGNHPDMVQLFIDKGAFIGCVTEHPDITNHGRTALAQARAKGKQEVVRIIEDALANKDYGPIKLSIRDITTRLYNDPHADLAAQGEAMDQFMRSLNPRALRTIRNTIFAKYMYRFKDEGLQKLFRARFGNYAPHYKRLPLSEYDKKNIAYIRGFEGRGR